MNSNMTEQLDQLFRMWDRGLCPGAQVLIRQHGKTLYEKCFGYGNLENKLKIHKESIFHVASISKEFTVMSILLLWKEGKLDLEDDIRKYLNEYINIETPITIRQMMISIQRYLFRNRLTLNRSHSIYTVTPGSIYWHLSLKSCRK